MCFRLSFVGERGYEVHCKRADADKIFGAVMEQVDMTGGCLAGYRTMESLSTEVGT